MEETISLSKIIKSTYTVDRGIKPRTIKIRPLVQEDIQDFEQWEEADDISNVVETVQQKAEEELAQARTYAEQLRAQAEEETRKIQEELELERQTAQAEIEHALAAAREEGYAVGFEQGQQDGRQSYDKLITQAKEMIEVSEREFERTIDTAEPIIIELASALAQRVVGKAITEDESIWASMLTQVMSEVREHEHVKLYVHPDAYTQTVDQKEELEQLLSHTEKLFIYPDAGLIQNGCIVESKYGRIDATIDRQLQELKKQLLAKLEEGSNEG